MRVARVLMVLAVLSLVALPGLAEQQYGSIDGRAVDKDGAGLPGVSVEVRGDNLQGTRSTETDATGKFRVTPLPPGLYTVRLTLEGFDTLEKKDLTVNLGRTTSLEAQMTSREFEETVVVTAEGIVVDTTKSGIDMSVDAELIDSLVNARNFQGVTDKVPGVQMNANNPRVHGASSSDNLYLVDGVDTTDPRTQTWGTAVNFDTVQEVQVQTAGYSAEYGRVTGGIVNLVTKSGGNTFSGLLRYIISDQDWADSPQEGRAASNLGDEKRPVVNLGGPIVKDKLWFFAAYEGRDRTQTFSRYTDPTTTTLGSDTSSYEGQYVMGKLTFQANDSNNLVGWYNEDPIDISNVWGRYYLGPAVDPRSEATQEQGGNSWSVQMTNILNEDAFLETKYGDYGGNINVVAQGPYGPEPTMLEDDTGYWSGTSLEHYQSLRERQSLSTALSYFLDASGSTHELKVGLEYLENKNSVLDAYYPSGGLTAPGAFVITVGGAPALRLRNYDRDGLLVSKNPYYAVYVQDAWKRGKLTLNLGLRAEKVDLENDAGDTVAGFDFGDQIAPRLGFAYDLGGDSIHGSFGRFYDIPTDYITAGLQPSTERQGVDISCSFYGVPAVYCDNDWYEVADYAIKSSNSIDSGIDPTYTDEVTVGYTKRLSKSMSLDVNYINRQQKDAIEDFDSGTNGDAVADDGSFFYTNVPGSWLKYQAVELSFRKATVGSPWEAYASYTYQFQNEGYATGTSTQGFGSQFSGYGDSSVAIDNRYGDLDTEGLFKFGGAYHFTWGRFGLLTGLSGYYYSGGVWTTRETVRLNGSQTHFLEPAGSNDIGSEMQIDLHTELDVNLKSTVSLAAYIDVLNITDEQEPLRINNLITSGSYGKANLWQIPRRYQVGFKLEF